MPNRTQRIGLWMIGACGGVGSTVALGVAALRKGLSTAEGLVSDLPPFRSAGLVDPGRLVLGGHDIRAESLLDAVRTLHDRSGLFDEALIRGCAPQLRSANGRVRPGTLLGVSPRVRRWADRSDAVADRSAAAAIERLCHDIRGFRERHRLDQAVVLYVASSEPRARPMAAHGSYARLSKALARPAKSVLPASSLYALAAIEAGCAFVNFTPSTGLGVPAIRERAEARGVPFMGNDGKTGETLLKSALAPMFAMRNLNVLSWVGQNLLGNRDGAVLDDPQTRAAKQQSKDKAVSQICGSRPATRVGIDYVPSLHDWKIAWDYIHFSGFLGTRMSLQFTWHAADSVLAAPLVIDLARFAAHEAGAARGGPMRHLAFFFKDPIDVEDQNLFTQWQRLIDHFAAPGQRSAESSARGRRG